MRNLRTIRKVSEIMPKVLNTSQSFAYSSKMNIDDEFQLAQSDLKKLNDEPPNELKLRLYALYKQSTVGQCNVAKPSALDMVGKAKWGAWSSLGSMSSAEAMTQYVDTVKLLLKDSGVETSDASDSSPQPEILVENKSGVCLITLNRPKKFNAISHQMYEQWIEALNNANKDESVRLGLITGNGDFFCSGNDLSQFNLSLFMFHLD